MSILYFIYPRIRAATIGFLRTNETVTMTEWGARKQKESGQRFKYVDFEEIDLADLS